MRTLSAKSVCHNDNVPPVLTSHFPDSAFSADAYFRKFLPSRKSRVKYFKRLTSEYTKSNIRSHKYTFSNAKKASAEPIFTVRSTCDWLRTDASAPPYRRVRTVVVVRPYENNHLFPLFRARRGTIPDVLNCVRPYEKTDGRERRERQTVQKERESAKKLSTCISRIAREGPSRSPIRIWAQRSPFSGDSFDVLTKRHNRTSRPQYHGSTENRYLCTR